ncbi:MAG: tRNA pseudouridine(38-40) synthase TruA [Candidatus Aminicenantales bacterium]
MKNYRLTISYDGTDYHGWQRQPKKRTIQGVIEEALSNISGTRTVIHGAGRTDAGVHALAQVAHFKADLNLDPPELQRALNAILPPDMRINSVEKAEPDFHARKDACSKVYLYRILNSPQISPFLVRYVLHWPHSLDVKKMKKGAVLFKREADFSPFSSGRYLNPVRKVIVSRIEKKEDEIHYTVVANGFLRYMVRTMVGTLIEIGRGKIEPETIDLIFREKNRSLAGPTAKAKGLSLVKVNY